MQPLTSAGHLGLGVGREHDEGVLDAPVGRVGHVRDARQAVELDVVLGGARGRARCGARWRSSAISSNCAAKRCTAARGRLQQLADDGVALGVGLPACGAPRPRPGGGAAPRSAARGASGCRAGRPAGRGCAAPPRCRPAPRTACAPSGRCGAPRAAGSAPPRRARRAGGSRSRGRRTRCSCRESRAGAARPRGRRRPGDGGHAGSGKRVRSWGPGAPRPPCWRLRANRTAAQQSPCDWPRLAARRVIPVASQPRPRP